MRTTTALLLGLVFILTMSADEVGESRVKGGLPALQERVAELEERVTTLEQATDEERTDAVVLQSWSKKIPESNHRFVLLEAFSSGAVLDKETGLVWERDPTFFDPNNVGEFTNVGSWSIAAITCVRKIVGGRKGWRLSFGA